MQYRVYITRTPIPKEAKECSCITACAWGYLLVLGTLTITLAIKLIYIPKPQANPKPDLFLNLGARY